MDASVRGAGDVPVMSRFDNVWEEAARDLGANRWQIVRLVVLPVLAPGLVAVALFGFTLSYDEFARTLQTPARSIPCRWRFWRA